MKSTLCFALVSRRHDEPVWRCQALHDLNIERICASCSQAKGRVERGKLTLQDWLFKGMRLKNTTDIDAANGWVERSSAISIAALRGLQNTREICIAMFQ